MTTTAAVDFPILSDQNHNQPVGVFDSGVGGLSVLQRIRDELPRENLLYVADSEHAPYGNKPVEFIARRVFAITEFLVDRGVKAVVVACNTATAAAIAPLRARFDIPIIGIEPALKPAVATTRTGVVGILATGNTVASNKFADLLDHHGHQARVLVQPCPGLADCVERGDLHGPRPHALLARYLQPLLEQNADTLVLGCTHYPFLIPLIQQLVDPNVTILDPGPAVARQLRHRLEMAGKLAGENVAGGECYFTSGAPARTAKVMRQLLNRSVTLAVLPKHFRSGTAFLGPELALHRIAGHEIG